MKRIWVKNKKELQKLIKEYRKKGYFLVTYGYTLVELEKGNEFLIISC